MHRIRIRLPNGEQRDAETIEPPASWTADIMREFLDDVFVMAFGQGRHEYMFVLEKARGIDALMLEIHVGNQTVRIGPAAFSNESIAFLQSRAEVTWEESKNQKEH